MPITFSVVEKKRKGRPKGSKNKVKAVKSILEKDIANQAKHAKRPTKSAIQQKKEADDARLGSIIPATPRPTGAVGGVKSHLVGGEIKKPRGRPRKIVGGATAQQKGESAELRTHIYPLPNVINQQIKDDLNAIVHSADRNPDKGQPGPNQFADPGNLHDPNADIVIAKGYENLENQRLAREAEIERRRLEQVRREEERIRREEERRRELWEEAENEKYELGYNAWLRDLHQLRNDYAQHTQLWKDKKVPKHNIGYYIQHKEGIEHSIAHHETLRPYPPAFYRPAPQSHGQQHQHQHQGGRGLYGEGLYGEGLYGEGLEVGDYVPLRPPTDHKRNCEGGALANDDFQALLKKSYEKTPSDYNDFKVDKSLSGQRAQVYKNSKTGQVVVVHRGTADMNDWVSDARYAMGDTSGARFQHAKKVQKQAEDKYGAKNITTIGHSLGATLAEKAGGEGKEVITLNKPVSPYDVINHKVSSNQTDVKTGKDPVSFLRGFQSGGNTNVLKSDTWNPLAEHSTDTLSRGIAQGNMWGSNNSAPQQGNDANAPASTLGKLQQAGSNAYNSGKKFLFGGKLGECECEGSSSDSEDSEDSEDNISTNSITMGKRPKHVHYHFHEIPPPPSRLPVAIKGWGIDPPSRRYSSDPDLMEGDETGYNKIQTDGDLLYYAPVSGSGIFGKTGDKIIDAVVGKKNRKYVYQAGDIVKPLAKQALGYGIEALVDSIIASQPELLPFRAGAIAVARNLEEDFLDHPGKYQDALKSRAKAKALLKAKMWEFMIVALKASATQGATTYAPKGTGMYDRLDHKVEETAHSLGLRDKKGKLKSPFSGGKLTLAKFSNTFNPLQKPIDKVVHLASGGKRGDAHGDPAYGGKIVPPHRVKGSAEAKAYMKMLRDRRGV